MNYRGEYYCALTICLLSGMLSEYQTQLGGDVCSSLSCWFLCTSSVQCWERSVKSLTEGVGFLFSPYRLFRFCFMYLEALLFGTYLFKIVCHLGELTSFVIFMSLLFLVIFLALKFTSSDMNNHSNFLFILYAWHIFFYPFTFNPST